MSIERRLGKIEKAVGMDGEEITVTLIHTIVSKDGKRAVKGKDIKIYLPKA